MAVIAIYALRLDHAVGLIVDDAWYVVLAKALAEGQGFRLISSATAAIMPAVPPGFPAILSPIFLISSFPENLIWLKLVSVLAMLATGVVCWIDFTRYRDVPPAHALLLAAATVITPAFVFLATSTVMAECAFTLAQLLAVVLVERVARDRHASDRSAVIAGLAGAATILIRLLGVAVVGASIAYLLINRRWRQAAVLAGTVIVCMVPWQLYARAHQPTIDERVANGGTIAYSYQQLLAMRRPGDTRAGEASVTERIVRAGRNAADIAGRDVGAILVPSFYRGPSESGQELLSVVGGVSQTGSMGRGAAIVTVSAVLTALIVFGISRQRRDWLSMPALVIVASLLVIVAVGSQTFRYLVPLTPYLLLFFWRAFGSGAAARIAVLCVAGFNLIDHGLYIHQKLTGTPPWLAEFSENDEILTWMSEHVTEPGAVASTNPGLVYLRTGRKGVVYLFPEENQANWKAAGVRYIVALKPAELPPPSLKTRLLFRTKHRLWIVEM
ncbi:MAG TPA: hypothetical protein VFZ31_07895 [Vicinamibacterales bacterium]